MSPVRATCSHDACRAAVWRGETAAMLVFRRCLLLVSSICEVQACACSGLRGVTLLRHVAPPGPAGKWIMTNVSDTKYELAYTKAATKLLKYFKVLWGVAQRLMCRQASVEGKRPGRAHSPCCISEGCGAMVSSLQELQCEQTAPWRDLAA